MFSLTRVQECMNKRLTCTNNVSSSSEHEVQISCITNHPEGLLMEGNNELLVHVVVQMATTEPFLAPGKWKVELIVTFDDSEVRRFCNDQIQAAGGGGATYDPATPWLLQRDIVLHTPEKTIQIKKRIKLTEHQAAIAGKQLAIHLRPVSWVHRRVLQWSGPSLDVAIVQ